ncbi:hypothetical protein EZS27_003597 [termite gut metagenome]|uniref:Uncharacterized protein n=1 Tax=termite gut metagenome TaxID=433724 RepID=A0A5J4SSK6_9ZZZZ
MEILTKRPQGMSFKAYREHLKAQKTWLEQRIKYGPPATNQKKSRTPRLKNVFQRLFSKKNKLYLYSQNTVGHYPISKA